MASLRRFWLLVSSELFESDCFDPADPKQPIADQGAHQQVAAPPSGDVSGDSAPRASPFRASLAEVRLVYRIRRRRLGRSASAAVASTSGVRLNRGVLVRVFVVYVPTSFHEPGVILTAPSNYYCCCFFQVCETLDCVCPSFSLLTLYDSNGV